MRNQLLLAMVCSCASLVSAACGDGGSTPGGGGGGDGSTDARDAPVDVGTPDLPFDAWSPDWRGACDPVDQNCPAGQECILDCPDKTEFVCKPASGTKAPGEDCAAIDACVKGSICTGAAGAAKCRRWCRGRDGCGAGKECTMMGVTCKPGTDSPIGWFCSL